MLENVKNKVVAARYQIFTDYDALKALTMSIHHYVNSMQCYQHSAPTRHTVMYNATVNA